MAPNLTSTSELTFQKSALIFFVNGKKVRVFVLFKRSKQVINNSISCILIVFNKIGRLKRYQFVFLPKST